MYIIIETKHVAAITVLQPHEGSRISPRQCLDNYSGLIQDIKALLLFLSIIQQILQLIGSDYTHFVRKYIPLQRLEHVVDVIKICKHIPPK